jgi:hypothetical protein
MLIKKTEGLKNNSNLITNTLSNQNIFKNNFKKNSISICSSFRENNGLGNSKLKNTISFGNNALSKTNMSGLYNAKKLGNKENINNIHNNNVLTSTNLSLL